MPHKLPQRSLTIFQLQGEKEMGLRRNKKLKQRMKPKSCRTMKTLDQVQRCKIELQKKKVETWELGR